MVIMEASMNEEKIEPAPVLGIVVFTLMLALIMGALFF
jgi:hypothetical protein